ncbi:hypothetical protein BSL78_22541 [Apostichopus japonicus]|uniref:Uncharacterized protein n=1 Tax=Stichopus japonicus TaxID=307972 RepID=A0A2G8JY17_STIJA|nr:hypothetical protein BSL78_22541 [Apostichopus japonicus]
MTTESITTEVSGHQTTGNDNSSTADTKSIIDTNLMITGSIITVVAAQQTTGNDNSSTADTKSVIDTKLMINKHFITEAVTPTGNESSSTLDTKSMTTEGLTTEVSGHQTTGNANSSTADTKLIIDTKLMINKHFITEAVTPTGNESSSTLDTKSMTTEGLTTEVSGHQTTGNANSSTADTKSIIDTRLRITEHFNTEAVTLTGVPKVTFTTEVPILATMKLKENQIPVIILPVSIAIACFAVLSILLRYIEVTFRRSGSNEIKDPERARHLQTA